MPPSEAEDLEPPPCEEVMGADEAPGENTQADETGDGADGADAVDDGAEHPANDDEMQTPAPLRSIFKPVTPGLLPPPSPSVRRRRNIYSQEPRRRSARLAKKSVHLPVVMQAQITLCRRLGLLPEEAPLTEEALNEYKVLFNDRLPPTAIQAISTLLNLTNSAFTGRDEALALEHGDAGCQRTGGSIAVGRC